MTPGDSVRVTIGGRMHDAEVLYTRGVSVRVRLADGREKTVPVDRVRAASGAPPARRTGINDGPPLPRDVDKRVAEVAALGLPRLTAVPKPKPPWRSSAYMAHVRTFPCCVSAREFVRADEAHHHGPHAMSRKGPDWTCIPLSAHEHERFHMTGTFTGQTREETDAHAVRAQIECMTAWCEAHGLDYMTAVRDALARVVEGDNV